MSKEFTITNFLNRFPTNDACLEEIKKLRWGNTIVCPKCEKDSNFYRVKRRTAYACQFCGHHLYPLAGTIFDKTSTPLTLWFYAIYLMAQTRSGISAKQLQRELGVTYKTAWRMCKQIRLLMEQDGEILTGEVETDETYIGGRRKLAQKYNNKSIVFGVVERNGRAKVSHVKSSGARVLIPTILSGVAVNSHIYSDEFSSYRSLKKHGYSHTTVNHSKLEYVRGMAHTNTIEGFWSQLKRSIDGTYHAVSPKYLQSYINQFVFQYNFRGLPTCPVLLERAAKLS